MLSRSGSLVPTILCALLTIRAKISSVLYSAAGIPHSNTMAENAFYYTPVKAEMVHWLSWAFSVRKASAEPSLSNESQQSMLGHLWYTDQGICC